MLIREFHADQWLPRPMDEVFPFFGDAGNLQQLTPSWLRFKILTPRPIEMRPGALIDYRLRVHGFPLRWQSEITAWEPPFRFVDEQRRGPYRLWVHEHSFQSIGGGSLCRDAESYAVPFDILMHRLFVRPDIERIFAFRRCVLAARFGPAPIANPSHEAAKTAGFFPRLDS